MRMELIRKSFLAAGAAVLLASGVEGYQINSGPLRLPTTKIFQPFHETHIFYGPREADPGRWTHSHTVSWFNFWAYNLNPSFPWDDPFDLAAFPLRYGTFFLDYEDVALVNYLAYGLADRVDMVLRVPVYYLGGGIMDGFIEGFHDAFGIGQHHRTEFVRNELGISYIDEEGEVQYYGEVDVKGAHLGNLVLVGGYRFIDLKPDFTLRLAVKFPTHTIEIPLRERGVDFSLFSSLSFTRGRTTWYHSGGVTYFSETREDTPPYFKRMIFSSALTVEIRLGRRVGLLTYAVIDSPSADFPELDDPAGEVALGLRWFVKNYRIDFALVENVFWFDNSPDFGVIIDFRRTEKER